MSDIVERLRQGAGHEEKDVIAAECTMEEAADEIVRLREQRTIYRECFENAQAEIEREIERLKAALEEIASSVPMDNADRHFIEMARRALERKP